MTKIAIYDTTLRDGTQRESISLSLADKLRITETVSYTHLTLPTKRIV